MDKPVLSPPSHEAANRVLHLVSIHLRLDQSPLLIFIINFAIISFRVCEHIAIVAGSRAGTCELGILIPFTAPCGGLPVDSFPSYTTDGRSDLSTPDEGGKPLIRANGAHWPAADEIPVRAISTVAPKAFQMKLRAKHLSSSTARSQQVRTHNVLKMHRAKRA